MSASDVAPDYIVLSGEAPPRKGAQGRCEVAPGYRALVTSTQILRAELTWLQLRWHIAGAALQGRRRKSTPPQATTSRPGFGIGFSFQYKLHGSSDIGIVPLALRFIGNEMLEQFG